MDGDFHDKIAELCFGHYTNLPKTGKPKDNEWTVLSCIVQEDEIGFSVVALGTGTKCIGHDKLTTDGSILNDSHAEVICRRSFIRYIYENMLYTDKSFLHFDSEKRIFSARQGVSFHFFTTHVPCGDAAIFDKQEVEYFGTVMSGMHLKNTISTFKNDSVSDIPVLKKRRVESQERDIFRTGAKCLQQDERQDLKSDGPNFHIIGVVRTKPGRGSPTLSVSCSDKLAKWCHLGLQGALISILLDAPIYLSSFTIAGGTPFNDSALNRALFSRLQNVVLIAPFCRSKLKVGQSTLEFKYAKVEHKQPSDTSIIWWKSKELRNVEVGVNGMRQGVTKKQLKASGFLNICKKEMFQKFTAILIRKNIMLNGVDVHNLSYCDAKMNSSNYQKNWDILKNEFQNWSIKMPLSFCATTVTEYK